jgi:hypothetical protein
VVSKDMEGRHTQRKQIIYYLRVFEQDTGKLLGYLSDLTTKGFMTIGDKKVKAGKTYRLRMDLPQEMKGAKRIIFKAKALWCKPDANPDFCNTGYRMLNLSKEDTQTIDGLIRDFLYEEPEEETDEESQPI